MWSAFGADDDDDDDDGSATTTTTSIATPPTKYNIFCLKVGLCVCGLFFFLCVYVCGGGFLLIKNKMYQTRRRIHHHGMSMIDPFFNYGI